MEPTFAVHVPKNIVAQTEQQTFGLFQTRQVVGLDIVYEFVAIGNVRMDDEFHGLLSVPYHFFWDSTHIRLSTEETPVLS